MTASTDDPDPVVTNPATRLLPDVAPLPEDAVLLHIGVHKTGTTAIQAAFADARGVLASSNVTYPGALQAQHRAALVALNRPWGWSDRGGVAFPRAEYDDVIRQSRMAHGRVVISSEFWCEADEATAQRVVEDLGAERVHVVVTLRHLASLLPSSYQQYLKYGLERDYPEWLTDILTGPGRASPTFWRRHDHGAVIRRWLTAVPADRISVVVLEDVDRSAVFRTFAQLVDIDDSVLVSRMNLTSNRSMTAAEAAMLLAVNRSVRQRLTWPEYSHYVRRGVAHRLVEGREPAAWEPRLRTPDWALSAAADAAAASVDVIEASGVRVIGDLGLLRGTQPPGSSSGGGRPGSIADPHADADRGVRGDVEVIPVGTAAQAIIAAVDAALADARRPIPTRTLLAQLRTRLASKVARTGRRLLRR